MGNNFFVSAISVELQVATSLIAYRSLGASFIRSAGEEMAADEFACSLLDIRMQLHGAKVPTKSRNGIFASVRMHAYRAYKRTRGWLFVYVFMLISIPQQETES